VSAARAAITNLPDCGGLCVNIEYSLYLTKETNRDKYSYLENENQTISIDIITIEIAQKEQGILKNATLHSRRKKKQTKLLLLESDRILDTIFSTKEKEKNERTNGRTKEIKTSLPPASQHSILQATCATLRATNNEDIQIINIINTQTPLYSSYHSDEHYY